MLKIDGSHGEGGGQIVRTSLAMALVTGTPVTIAKIRAGRKQPGLKRQHLVAVEAAQQVGAARVKGAKLSSRKLVFEPTGVFPGKYHFKIDTAGSSSLVLQTVLPALLSADGPSTLVIEGGTHNSMAPPFEALAHAYLPLVARMGPQVRIKLEQHGFYPVGKGRVLVEIEPAPRLAGFDLLDRGALVARRIESLVARLPAHIGNRECETIAAALKWPASVGLVNEITNSAGPGNAVLVTLRYEHITEVFTGFGQRGVPAEKVAAGVAEEVARYLASDVPVGEHLADQLMLPLALSAAGGGGGGSYRTLDLSGHSKTHIDVLQTFLPVSIDVDRRGTDDVTVSVRPREDESS